MQVRLRYKEPDGETSRLLTEAVSAVPRDESRDESRDEARSENFSFSAAVAGFGMLLRDSKYKGDLTTDHVLALANQGRGDDPHGDRAQFIQLVERFRELAQQDGEPSTSRR
jgi:Ca-activated chloride channel family protein